MKELPVSTSTRPSSVLMADTLANEGTKDDPVGHLGESGRGTEGVDLVVETSPLHSRSATASTSCASGIDSPFG
jgi:hypothetical protein